ncbi:hypothetical protein [Clostridium sp.]
MDIRNSFSDYFIFTLNGRMTFQTSIFIMWSVFWLNRFHENTLLDQIRYGSYSNYLSNKLNCIMNLLIATVGISLVGILIGGLGYKAFGMPNFIYNFISPSKEFLSVFIYYKDTYGNIIILLSIIYLIFGYLFLSVFYYYIVNIMDGFKSKVIILLLFLLNIKMVIVGPLSFGFDIFKYIWYLYPNYYISLPLVLSEKGIYGGIFTILIEIVFIMYVVILVMTRGNKWVRR